MALTTDKTKTAMECDDEGAASDATTGGKRPAQSRPRTTSRSPPVCAPQLGRRTTYITVVRQAPGDTAGSALVEFLPSKGNNSPVVHLGTPTGKDLGPLEASTGGGPRTECAAPVSG
eukprot:CAMPEP_0184386066 /NCGR_PEP_ID=MMETSP0007-20130409/9431_1 /TAXON_ID=97485 /ORGANISM="Prymnesium parvum, Strain Texoma1" /LENGTH=116 /DNA_ID=CAMNT_0026733739 /DNA_START=107 /DNA_END=452 /DNA_ORIENTATION=+